MTSARHLSVSLIFLVTLQPFVNGRQVSRGQATNTTAPALTRKGAQEQKPAETPKKIETQKNTETQKGSETEDAARRRESFEIVWRTVKENHFDPNFGGVNWDSVHAEFAPLVERAQSDREFHLLLQQMLNRLGKSHFQIIPPEDIPATDEDEAGGDDAADDDEPGADKSGAVRKRLRRGSRDVAERLTYGIGIDFRIINGSAVVTRVEPTSSAARAGLRTGYVLQSIDGRTLASILRDFAVFEIYEPAVRNQLPEEIIVGYLNGPAGSSVRVAYLDGLGRLRRVVVPRERLGGELAPTSASLPAQFVEFESKRLRGGVGYIRFNLFVAPVLEKFCAALRSMKDAPGVVLDLRGNRGGLLGLIYGLGGLLETRAVSFGVMRMRAGWLELRIFPQRSAYRGQLAVLVDGETESAGEIFAGGLQASGRAVVVGERSAGATLPSTAKELPTGAILQYAFADFVTANGTLIEGSGIVPNVNVKLTRRSLLAGRDAQLEAALALVMSPSTRARAAETTSAKANEAETNEAETNDKALTKEKPQGVSSASEASKKSEGSASGFDPEVEPIIEKFVAAVGGRAGLERLTSRVSKGRFQGSFGGIGVDGAVEILEKSPQSYAALINVAGLGVIRRAFTGSYGYEQIPLYGFRRLEGRELADLKLSSDFRWAEDFHGLYPSMRLKGREKVGGSDTYVVEATPAEGSPVTFYFDVQTGLLLRKDRTYFEDYREVDGVKLPFKIRDDFSLITLTEVKHNLPVDDARFVEEKNCFTQ